MWVTHYFPRLEKFLVILFLSHLRCPFVFVTKSQPNGVYDLEAELASLTELLTDIPGEDGPSPLDAGIALILLLGALIKGFLLWHVAVEIAVAREIGMRQRPLPCKYCMADPMSSSMSFATWCSVIVRDSLDDDVLGFLGWTPPFPLAWTQSLTPWKQKIVCVTVKGKSGIWESSHAWYFWFCRFVVIESFWIDWLKYEPNKAYKKESRCVLCLIVWEDSSLRHHFMDAECFFLWKF